jgi:hypothetical protein
MKFDPEKLEVVVSQASAVGRGKPKWEWSVCEKGGPPVKWGIVTGARSKALAAGQAAMEELIIKAQRSWPHPEWRLSFAHGMVASRD